LFDEDRSVGSLQRELFLWRALVASLVLHSVIMTILILRGVVTLPHHSPKEEKATAAIPAETRSARVYMPRPEEMRRLLQPSPARRPPEAKPAPPTPPPAASAKDRISIGPPDSRRVKELVLRRDQDIPKTSQGNGALGPNPTARAAAPTATSAPPSEDRVAREAPAVGRGDAPLADASRSAPIMGSLRRMQEKWAQGGTGLGMGPSGPKDIDGVRYDPHGADFTEWINHMSREVYRNWLLPEAARLGFGGKVTIRFLVARDGSLVGDEVLESSGTRSLDVAARDAMRAARLLPLPADFAPAQFERVVCFSYNVSPRPS
jgi:TonB family protein